MNAAVHLRTLVSALLFTGLALYAPLLAHRTKPFQVLIMDSGVSDCDYMNPSEIERQRCDSGWNLTLIRYSVLVVVVALFSVRLQQRPARCRGYLAWASLLLLAFWTAIIGAVELAGLFSFFRADHGSVHEVRAIFMLGGTTLLVLSFSIFYLRSRYRRAQSGADS